MNKPIKKLNLSRETIRNLQPDEMKGVGGGTETEIGCASLVSVITVSIYVSVHYSCICPSKAE